MPFKKMLHLKKIDVLILVCGAILILPFLYSRATIDPVLLPQFLALSVLTLILLSMFFILASTTRVKLDFSILNQRFFAFAACYLAISGLSTIGAINLAEAIFEWLKIILSFIFLAIASLIIVNSRDNLKIVSRGVVVTGLILALIGFGQSTNTAFLGLPGSYGPYATMANRNLLASALFMTLPFTLFGLLQFSGYWLIVSFLSWGMTIYIIAVVQARTVWIALTLSTCLALFFTLFLLNKRPLKKDLSRFNFKNRVILISLGILMAGGLHAVSYVKKLPPDSPTRPVPGNVSAENAKPPPKLIMATDTLRERLMLWKKTIAMATDHPFLGVGPGQWRIQLPAYGHIRKMENTPVGNREIWFQRPHNDFLWVLAEIGIPGFLCYASLVVVLLFYAFKIAVYSTDVGMRLFALVVIFGLAGYAIIAGLSFPKERVFHIVLFALTAASVISAYHWTFHTRVTSAYSKRLNIAGIFFLISVIFCLVFGYLRLISDVHIKNAISAHHQQNWQRVVSEIDQVNQLVYNLDPASTPASWYRGMANFQLGKLTAAHKDFKEAERANPNHIHVLNNLGVCWALKGEYVIARQYYERLLAIAPDFEHGIDNLKLLNLFENWGNRKNENTFLNQIEACCNTRIESNSTD